MVEYAESLAIFSAAKGRSRSVRRAIGRHRTATALAGGLAATILLSVPAAAQSTHGGHGGRGSSSVTPPAGGTSSDTGAGQAGTAGTSFQGGAGGGAGATGGDGGAAPSGDAGGAGGATPGAAGASGGSAYYASGGGGGAHGTVLATTATPGTDSIGGRGGDGGNGSGGDGGGGGAGGYGVVVDTGGSLIFDHLISGGIGGNGGEGYFYGGGGGDGGHGLVFAGTATAVINAAVTGGNGGAAGINTGGAGDPGAAGNGGIGILGSDVTLTLNAAIGGGLGGDGVTPALALSLGGISRITLGAGWSITGGIEIAGQDLTIVHSGDQSLDSVISGTGLLAKIGSDTLTLTGANTYTGGTFIANGTLQIGDGGTTGVLGAGDVTNEGLLAFNRSDDIIVANNITGTGGLDHYGAGTLTLTGGNTYAGNTHVYAGTLAIGVSGGASSTTIELNNGTRLMNAISAGSRAIDNAIQVYAGAATIDSGGGETILGGVISGDGDLNFQNGSFVLTASNNYGATIVASDGILQVGDGGTDGTLGNDDVTVDGALVYNRSDDVTVSAGIRGNGGLTQSGGGMLILTGANSYLGGTVIAAGTLQMGDGGTDGELGSGGVTDEGVLAFNRSDDISFAQDISGGGSVTMLGAGSVTLSGNNSYGGGTTISGGTLVLGSATAYGAGNILLDGGTLDIDALGFDVRRLDGSTGTIIASGGGALDVASGKSVTFGSSGGAITTALGLSVDATSTLTLLGNNDLTGGILVAGRLVIGETGAAGGEGNLIGTIGSVISYADGVDNAAAVAIASDTTQLEVVGTDAAFQSGSILEDQPGRGFEKIGTGTLILTTANNYTGTTLVSAGTLGLGDDLAAGTGQITLANDTTLLNSSCGCSTLTLANAIHIASGGTATIDADGYETVLSGNLTGGDLIFADTYGGGITILTGDNSYGATMVESSATLQIGDGGTTGTLGTGSITTDGMLAFNRSDIVTLSTAVGGTGLLGQFGTGTLIVTADNDYSGGTLILDPDGTLQVGDGGTTGTLGSGDIAIAGGTLIFNRSDDLTVGGYILGDGQITKLGAGTLTLSGDNLSYAGTISARAGTIAFTESGLGSGLVEIDNGATLQALEDAFAGYVTILSGGGTIDTGSYFFEVVDGVDFQGELTKTGSGTLMLTDYFEEGIGAGGINVTAGTLGLGSDFAAGTGFIRLADGTTLLNGACGCSRLNVDNDIQIAIGGTAMIDGDGGDIDLNGAITGGNVAFTTNSTGSIIRLYGANSYGSTLIGVDVALILRDGTLGTGDVTFDATPSDPGTPAALVFQTDVDYSYGGRIIGAGIVSVEADPASSITLTGSNTAADNFTGSVEVLSGRLAINGDFGDVVGNSATLLVDGGCFCGGTATLGGSGTFHGDVTIDNAVLAPGNSPGTLSIAGNLTLGTGTILNYELGAPGRVGGTSNDLVNVGGNLTLDGTLNTIASGAGYGPGYYRLFNYGGLLIDNGVGIGTIDGGLDATVLTNIGGQVNLRLGGAQAVQYWDGADLTGASNASTGDGGAGTWNDSATNWTGPTGYAVNDAWQNQSGVFGGAAGGIVNVANEQAFEELRFETDGYQLRPMDPTARLGTTGAFSIVDVSAGVTADIGVIIQGSAGLDKTGDGTLILSAVNSYSGATDIAAGTLRMGIANAISTSSDVSVSAGATLDLGDYQAQIGSLSGAGTVTLGTAGQLSFGYTGLSTTFSGDLSGGGTVNNIGPGTFTLAGSLTLTDTDPDNLTVFAIDSGTVAVAGTGSLTSELVQNYATLANAGSITTSGALQNFGTFTNDGTVAGPIQNFGTFDNNATGTIASLQHLGGTATNAGTINLFVSNFSTFINTGVINGALQNFSTAQLEGQLNGVLISNGSGAITTLTGTVTGITYYQGVDGSLFDLAGFNTQVGGLAGSGAIQLGTATLTLGGTNAGSAFYGVISGSGGLIKIGAETQTLGGVNDYTGATAVDGGTLELAYGGALTSDVTIASGATFANAGGVTGLVTNEGTLTSIGTIGSIGPVALINNSGGVVVAEGQIDGAVQNSGSFRTSAGLTGITDFSQAAGGQLTLDYHLDLGALNGSGIVELGISTLTIGAGGLGSTFGGAISGDGGLTKTGSGTLTLGGTNSYTGQTLVTDGTLVVSSTGTIAGEVANNANLVSTGALNGGLTNNGIATVRGVLGGLVQNQSGSITLTGATGGDARFVQSIGALLDLAGFNASLGSLNGDGSVNLGSGTLTAGSRNTNMDFAGVITGTGGLTKTGEGTLTLSGASNYSGVTTISDGTLLLADGGTIGAGNVLADANLAFDGTIDRVFGNVIQGSGGVTQLGPNLLTLTGLNSYAGGSNVFGGTLAFDNGQALGTGVIRLSDGTALSNVQGGGALTLGNDITGAAGAVTLEGIGGASTILGGEISDGDFRFARSGAGATAFTLTAANFYGDTQIGADVSLTVAGSGTLGSGDTILDSADSTLIFANAANYNYGGTIIGGGNIVVDTAPAVSVTLSGPNSAGSDFTGTVAVDGGTLVLGSDFGDLTGNTASLALNGGALGGSGTFYGDISVGNGTLSPGNSPGTLNIAGNLALGAGTILNYELSESGTPGGANNDLINVGGNLTLDGTLNVTALAGFGEGYYRLLNYGGSLTDNGLLFGALPVGYTSTLLTNIGGQVNILFASSPQAIQYWDGSDLTGATSTVGGNGGAGSWSATGTNWTAPTGYGVNGNWLGQVAVFGGASGGNVAVQGIQTFQELRFTTGGYVITGATLADGLATAGGFSVIDVSSGSNATINAVISGAGGLTLTGAGTLSLGGTNSYGGTTTASGGTLQLTADGSLAGGVVNDAVFDNRGTVTGQVVNNAVMTSTGTLNGGLTNNGTATLQGIVGTGIVNNGTVTFTGAATIAALQQAAGGSFNLGGSGISLGTIAGSGAVNLGNGTLTIGAGNGNSSFAGTISGTGALVRTGTGTLVLTGTATHTGGTTIAGGTLQIGTGGATGSLSGAITNNGVLVLNRSDAVTLANVMSGAGGFVQAGTGTTTLTGANSYTGGTLVSAGRLRGDTASLQGNIRIDTALEFAQTGAGIYAGSLSGAGLFDKTGTGTLVLTGNSAAFTGATHLLGGGLAVNGLLSHSIITVSGGATLSGIGTAGGVILQSGATIAPGNSVGTFNVAGNVQLQTGSLFAAEVQASGSDQILATGTAQLGGTLQVINLGGNYGINSSFVLLHADAGVSGTFNVTNLNSFGLAYRPSIVYTANEVQLFLAANQLSAVLGTGVPLTYNQASTIARIDAAVVTGGYDPTALSALYSLAPAAIPAALDQLSGEIYATATRTALEDERVVREAATSRLATAADLGLTGNGVWGQAIGSWGSGDSDGNAARYGIDRAGFVMGMDAGEASDEGSWRAGVMGHYTRITVPVSARGSRATIDRTGGGFYAGAAINGWRISTGASVSLLELKVKREIAVPGLSTTERAKSQGMMFQTFGELSYRIGAGTKAFVEPYLAGSVTRVTFDRFAESSGPVALTVRAQKSVLALAELGLRGETALVGGETSSIRLGGNIGLRTAFGDRTADPIIALAAAPDQAFAVRSAEIDRFAAVANLNLTVDLSDTLNLRIGYSGVLGGGAREHGGRATISLKF